MLSLPATGIAPSSLSVVDSAYPHSTTDKGGGDQTSSDDQASALALLLTCARTPLTTGQTEELSAHLARIDHWPTVLTLAGRHGLLPLLYWQLTHYSKQGAPQTARAWIPASVMTELAQHYHRNNFHCIKLGRALGGVLQCFAEAQIPVLVLKGLSLGQAIYGNAALREAGDLDLLVHPADAQRAMALLATLGYQVQPSAALTPNQQKAWVRFKSERHFSHPEEGIELDLHWRLLDQQSGFDLDFTALWARRSTLELYGYTVKTLGIEDGLLYLALHGAKHGWIVLKWLCDLAEYCRAYPTVDWAQLTQRAAEIGATPLLWQGLSLAQQLLATPWPVALTAQPSPMAMAPAVVEAYQRLLLNNEPAVQANYLFSSRQSNSRLASRQARSALRKCWQAFLVLVTPTGAEIQWASLPPALAYLYYLLRLVRLLWKWVERWLPAMRFNNG